MQLWLFRWRPNSEYLRPVVAKIAVGLLNAESSSLDGVVTSIWDRSSRVNLFTTDVSR